MLLCLQVIVTSHPAHTRLVSVEVNVWRMRRVGTVNAPLSMLVVTVRGYTVIIIPVCMAGRASSLMMEWISCAYVHLVDTVWTALKLCRSAHLTSQV